ncbi:MAG: hypothetical protein AAFX92_09275 [Pseudomonadota bacterium]
MTDGWVRAGLRLALGFAVLSVPAALAQDPDAVDEDTLGTLAAMCGSIDEPLARLDCYDSFMLLFEASIDGTCPETVDAVMRATIVDWVEDEASYDGECVIGLSVQSVAWMSDAIDVQAGDRMDLLTPCTSNSDTLTLAGSVSVVRDQTVEAHVHLMCGLGMLRPVWDEGGIQPIGPQPK